MLSGDPWALQACYAGSKLKILCDKLLEVCVSDYLCILIIIICKLDIVSSLLIIENKQSIKI